MHARGKTTRNFSFFHDGSDTLTPPLDESFTNFPIPSAKSLYSDIIFRDNFELISELSLGAIIRILVQKDCDMDQFRKLNHKNDLSPTLHRYVFQFKKTDGTNEAFLLRKKIFTELHNLRKQVNDLFLDKSLQIHLSDTENYTFLQSNHTSLFPQAYRALCIYDLVVEELYLHNLKRKDNDFKDSLISDYLCIHTNKFDGFEKAWNSDFEVKKKLVQCLRDIPCDKKSATLLESSFEDHIDDNDKFSRGGGVLDILPLTHSAHTGSTPSLTDVRNQSLNRFAHQYCSLIQYRYLLDLQCLHLSTANEMQRAEDEIQRINDEMKRWKNFKHQPMILKFEALTQVITDFICTNHADFLRSDTFFYWDARTIRNNCEAVLIYSLHPRNSGALTQNIANAVEKLLNTLLLTSFKHNFYMRHEYNYMNGYYHSITQDSLARLPLNKLLIVSENSFFRSDHIGYQTALLCNKKFFETNTPRQWLNLFKSTNNHSDELEKFIWNLATFNIVNEWFYHQKNNSIPDHCALPMDIVMVIIDFIKRDLINQDLLKQDKDNQISTRLRA